MGNDEGNDKKKRVVFVTVGTTCFDALVRAVDSNNVKQALFAKGYTHLLIQMGRGSYLPTKSEGDGSLAVDYFTFSSSIADHLRSASLVISHAEYRDQQKKIRKFYCIPLSDSGLMGIQGQEERE
ncbi:UDP-N-acetylglucosamine transferase subunit ALG13-like [Glycine soja]|uniref:UDP-N-acetylglucosamine transferase subunit ALG13-like n=1 Tax=Glycine soja TaxID=3848 RepID=A0A445KDR0_GLYSO|nr:UDP-N-acetylglucosamine transferase subunit ALG13-like [Glycine soja]